MIKNTCIQQWSGVCVCVCLAISHVKRLKRLDLFLPMNPDTNYLYFPIDELLTMHLFELHFVKLIGCF